MPPRNPAAVPRTDIEFQAIVRRRDTERVATLRLQFAASANLACDLVLIHDAHYTNARARGKPHGLSWNAADHCFGMWFCAREVVS